MCNFSIQHSSKFSTCAINSSKTVSRYLLIVRDPMLSAAECRPTFCALASVRESFFSQWQPRTLNPACRPAMMASLTFSRVWVRLTRMPMLLAKMRRPLQTLPRCRPRLHQPERKALALTYSFVVSCAASVASLLFICFGKLFAFAVVSIICLMLVFIVCPSLVLRSSRCQSCCTSFSGGAKERWTYVPRSKSTKRR